MGRRLVRARPPARRGVTSGRGLVSRPTYSLAIFRRAPRNRSPQRSYPRCRGEGSCPGTGSLKRTRKTEVRNGPADDRRPFFVFLEPRHGRRVMSDEARMALPLARDAFRLIRRNPVLSLVVVGSLAIGITINATAFSLIDSFVLRPLPIADPARLVGIRTVSPTGGTGGVSRDDFLDIQNGTRTLSAVAAYETAGAVVGNVGDTPEVVTLGVVTTNYFSLLGVDAVRGRLFGEIDRDVSQGAPGAV